MVTYKIIGGDYKGWDFGGISAESITLLGSRTRTGIFSFQTEKIELTKKNVKKVELVTEEMKKKSAGTAAKSGAAGGLLFGPAGLIVGALAGSLVGKNVQEVCFICYLKNGKKLMVQGDNKLYKDFLALTL